MNIFYQSINAILLKLLLINKDILIFSLISLDIIVG